MFFSKDFYLNYLKICLFLLFYILYFYLKMTHHFRSRNGSLLERYAEIVFADGKLSGLTLY